MWPFKRAKPAGYVDNDVPTHTELNDIDRQLAQAADGTMFVDAAIARIWPYESAALTNRGIALVWSGKAWVSVGLNGTAPEASRSFDGKRWSGVGTIGAGAGYAYLTNAASDGAGIVLVGGGPASGSTQKVRRSSDHGASWTIENTSAGGTTGVSVWWFAGAGLFVAQLSTGNIETSPDGITWTPRVVPSPSANLGGVAVSPTAIVCVNGVNRVVRSVDGITWTAHTIPLPPGGSPYGLLTYLSNPGRFVAFGNGGSGTYQLAVSDDDGVTWTTPALTALPEIKSVVGVGRMLVATATTPNRVEYSLDGGVTWKQSFEVPNLVQNGTGLQVGSGQLAFADNSAVHYATLPFGP